MTISVIQDDDKLSYDIYDRFTVEHFPLRQSMILTTSFFFCSQQYLLLLLLFIIYYTRKCRAKV
jgi:hypothetical protein